MTFSKKYFVAQWVPQVTSAVTPKTTHFFMSLIFNYSTINSLWHMLRLETVVFTPSTGYSLWGANWMSGRLASLQIVNVTRTSSIVITPWYQTGINNTNKTHCWGFRLLSFLEILSEVTTVTFPYRYDRSCTLK